MNVGRHAVRRRHPRRDRRPGQPDAGDQPGWRSRRTAPTACCPTCRSSGPAPSRAPANHPGRRRPVPRLQARRPGRQRGPVEHDGVRHQLRRERRVLRPRRPADAGPGEFPEEFVTLASTAGHPRRRPSHRRRVPGAGFIISPWTVGGQIFSEVSDHTSCLRLIESVAAAGGLSGQGPVTFPNISRWRRQTFSDLTGALRPVEAAARARRTPSSPRHQGCQPGRPADGLPASRCRRAPARPSSSPWSRGSRHRAHDPSRQLGTSQGRRGLPPALGPERSSLVNT